MKAVISIILMLTSLNLKAQQDDYLKAFYLAYNKLQDASQKYTNYLSDNKTDSSCVVLAVITQQYRTLLKVYDEAAFKYRHDASFDTSLQPLYLSIFERVEELFARNSILAQMETMVQAMVDIEREGFPKNDEEVKWAIEALYFQNYYHPDFLNNTLEGNVLRKQLQAMRAYIAKKEERAAKSVK